MADPLATARQAVAAATDLLAGPLPGKPPRPAEVGEKAPHDYVTSLDLACERAIVQVIRAVFPGAAVAGEEEARADAGEGRVWVVDPVDGTRNLVAGRPEVAVSVALCEDGQPLVGVLALPYRGLVLSASPDGAWLGASPLPPLPALAPDRALVGLPGELRPGHGAATFARVAAALAGRVEGIRISGALGYDLATLALGELHGRASVAAKAVDVAAGVCILRRVGAVVTDTAGQPYRLGSPGIVAAVNAAVHALVLDTLAAAR